MGLQFDRVKGETFSVVARVKESSLEVVGIDQKVTRKGSFKHNK